uniref:WSC domain-containing protein n=1 Tax=Chromera velia CCMP2878 TaxID=1169474 RepID=A0A0G4GR43_9ALVE|eukprot:Cvel_23008.t1-p1 / transcript=Cvel_23008.t1 / gene=Cvel_23008 / organism=Chromera_velia_CCMP2878 / gene_product=hypothetical protein / transcript_product=hypothetical protein / location=Cvel_scaffold2323:563-1705(+) / protein_length=168 / sequence_SO=supercontig / SO=protein_coding / is_pseudo=false
MRVFIAITLLCLVFASHAQLPDCQTDGCDLRTQDGAAGVATERTPEAPPAPPSTAASTPRPRLRGSRSEESETHPAETQTDPISSGDADASVPTPSPLPESAEASELIEETETEKQNHGNVWGPWYDQRIVNVYIGGGGADSPCRQRCRSSYLPNTFGLSGCLNQCGR